MANLGPRQIWVNATSSDDPQCSAFNLPASGTIIINATTTITLDQDATYWPECTAVEAATDVATLPVLIGGDPFEVSTVPQIFVLGCMMVIAWSLLIILLITPRTSFMGGFSGGFGGMSGGRHNTSGASPFITIGGRPWLQKFAAATVAISLVIATVNSFKIIEDQYNEGYQDADEVTLQVVGSYEIRIIRVISTTILWLAQVQTLIRLFPRHREKVIIKWSGFGLIVLNTLFAILNNFVANNSDGPKTIRPRHFTEAIPALAYLFEFALSLLYAAWVFYYAMDKRRFAFFHPSMRNICLVALLSIVSVSIPVVFFVMDIAKPDLTAWGEYIRWVGAAAASVVVWEWVERIEALEREERKDGILGREIYEEDDMLQTGPSVEISWPRSRSLYKSYLSRSKEWGIGGDGNKGGTASSDNSPLSLRGNKESRLQSSKRRRKLPGAGNSGTAAPFGQQVKGREQVAPPQPTLSPISRSDATSANSTVYAVVHHPVSPMPELALQSQMQPVAPVVQFAADTGPHARDSSQNPNANPSNPSKTLPAGPHPFTSRLYSVPNPFKRRRRSPPPEVSRSAVDTEGAPSTARWAKTRSPKNLFRLKRQQQVLPSELPVVVVPARPRGQVSSPPGEDIANAHLDNHNVTAPDMPSIDTSIPQDLVERAPQSGSSGNDYNRLDSPESGTLTHPASPPAEEGLSLQPFRSQPTLSQNSSTNATILRNSESLDQRISRVSPLPTVDEQPAQESRANVTASEQRPENDGSPPPRPPDR